MANKKADRKENRFKDIEQSMNGSPSPDDLNMTDELWMEKWIRAVYNHYVDDIIDSPVGPRFIDGKHLILPFNYDGIHLETGNYSFRFDVGRGFFLDFSYCSTIPDHPGVDLCQMIQIMEVIERIVPEVKDGMQLSFDELDRYGDSAMNLFAYPACYDIPVHWNSERDGQVQHDNFFVYEFKDGLYSVKYGKVRVLFPAKPADEEFEWMDRLLPELRELDGYPPSSDFNIHLWQGGIH